MPIANGVMADQGRQIAGRLCLMARHGWALAKTSRWFLGLCLAVPVLIALPLIFGSRGGGGSVPAPPPVIVGPGAGLGGSASYQFGTVQPAPDPAAAQRQQLFAAQADSLKSEPKAGVKCDRLVAAAQPLTAQDRAQPQLAAALGEADSCRAMVTLSDGRFAALAQAAAAYQADQTPATANALARAGQAMSGFDHSRQVADTSQALFDLAQVATAQLQDSDGRLKAFSDASASAPGGATLEARTRLAAAAQALTDFDRGRLSPAQHASYDAATDLAAQFQESDRRIAKAIERASSSTQNDSDDEAELVDAVGALTALDWQRAGPQEVEALNRARDAARLAALGMLVAVAPRLAGPVSPVADEQAARIRRVIGTIDLAGLSPAQQEALAAADRAAARVRASERRGDDMRTALDAWQKSPSPFAGSQVAAAYAAITDYDHGRFSAGERTAYAQLEGAYYVAAGKSLGLSPATKGKLPLFVVVREARNGPAEVFGAAVGDGLGRAGYNLAESRAAATMILEISATLDGQGVTQTSQASLAGALASATLRALWVADGSEFGRADARANGPGGTPDQAVTAAFRRAGELLAVRFDHFVETGEKQ